MKQLTPIEYERCYVAYRDFLDDALQTHKNDMRSALIWSENRMREIYRKNTDEERPLIQARRYLTIDDVNKIMYELLMGGVVNGAQY
ncbi:hypothetical protein [Furfurilactobacillus milii]|uniref:Phage protein n=1 Tax=Furfurilactobacillus milii TaxID=2888272 RepID=A0ABT6DCE1_9LACO|nr:hypothetical protein [Furfurilactobacillus milii]QLE66942.1 hypothetical protein LROSL2_1592 [Furfurilactobacillus rossiae]MCF6161952.1 hypothetical protein [Furfurilactobacillus milii]MCF6164332.1 hypothetical protein [Furfurilactobacillus milii]MDF9914820.1 hypothetical protein [Furfurilactobacillus milii]QLE69372.1 hypothetical protein LROSL3_1593 [Furfurilactobacillus rossiae]